MMSMMLLLALCSKFQLQQGVSKSVDATYSFLPNFLEITEKPPGQQPA